MDAVLIFTDGHRVRAEIQYLDEHHIRYVINDTNEYVVNRRNVRRIVQPIWVIRGVNSETGKTFLHSDTAKWNDDIPFITSDFSKAEEMLDRLRNLGDSNNYWLLAVND